MKPDEQIRFIQRHRPAGNNWHSIWLAGKKKGKTAAEALEQADKALHGYICRNVRQGISYSAVRVWRQRYAPLWGKGRGATGQIAPVDIPSLAALAAVQQPDSDDPIPVNLWLALQCCTMELCGYTLGEICLTVREIKTIVEVVSLINYAKRQDHAWRERQSRWIINAARENLIDDSIAANPEPQEVQL